MSDFKMFINNINDPNKRARMESILNFIKEKFPNLKEEIKWNQPMFSDHGPLSSALALPKVIYLWRLNRWS